MSDVHMPCKIALIGAGVMAEEHLRAFGDIPGVEISGIHSRTRQKAETLAARYGIAHVCNAISELYDRTGAHLVVNTASVESLKTTTLACLEHPWTILMEKPVGCDLREAREIHAAGRHRAGQVLVGLNRRFMSSARAVLADLQTQSGTRLIHIQDQEDTEAAIRDGFAPVVVKNWMHANAIHLIDFLTILGRGEIRNITPIYPYRPGKSHVVVAHIEYTSGDMGIYQGLWNAPGPWAISISTPEKRWEMRPIEQATYQLRGERRQQVVEQHPFDHRFKPGIRLQAEMAIAAARNLPNEAPTLDSAMKTMQLIEAIFR